MFKQVAVGALDVRVHLLLEGLTGDHEIGQDPVVQNAIKTGAGGMKLEMLRRMRHGMTPQERRSFVLFLLLTEFGCSENVILLLVTGGDENKKSSVT